MDEKTLVLEAMKEEAIPLNAGQIVELTADELITSPKRCYWQAK